MKPSTETQRRLLAIWQDLLGLDSIGVCDSFFDLGGHSLLAVCLFGEIEAAFGKAPPLGLLFRAPTIEQLATALQRSDVPDEDHEAPLTVALQGEGAQPPLFIVGGAGGMVFRCVPLARRLGPDRPTYGIIAQGVDSDAPIQTRIEEMAATYIRQMRDARPDGPYHLLGFSTGGAVVYEMARRLVEMGEPVGMLGMLDAWPPNVARYGSKPNLRSVLNMLANVPVWLYDAVQRSRGDLFAAATKRLAAPARRLRETGRRSKGADSEETAPDYGYDMSKWPDRAREVGTAHLEAYRQYQPAPYPGRVTVFLARRQPIGVLFTEDLGWRALARGGVTVHGIPGRHATITTEPHVGVLADKMRLALREAEDHPC